MPVFDAENADRRYVEFFEPREGSITVIRATEKTTLAKADISGPGPVMDMEKPVVHPIAKKPSPPALEPELKNPAPLSGFSLTAAADDAKQAAEEEDPLSGPRMEPLFNFEIPGPDLASDNAKKRAEGTYPALLGIKGLPNISVERSAVRLPGDMAEFFEALVAGYHPSGSRPEPLENFTLTAAEHPIQPPPEFEVKTVRDEPAPPAFVGSWSIKGAELPEPVTRKPPKIIEVSDYTGESAEPPFLAISNPAEGDTSKGLVEVRGEALGEGIESVLFVMGGIRRELLVSEGGFSTTVALEDGRNVLNASATDRYGRTAKTRVVVNYEPLDDGPIISFIKPMDGGIIDALKIRDIDITGAVKGAGVTSVRIYLNRTITDVPLTDGRFTLRALPEVEENTLFAEATGPGGKTSRSAEIKFRVVNLFPKDIAVVMETGGADGVTQVHRWRPRPDTDAKALPAPEFTDSTTANGHFTEVETAEPGIYTIGASYELKPGETVSATFHVTLYGYDPSSKKTRDIGPFVLRGRGYIPAVRVLMPECVFWEDDYWFSGIIESSSGTTKFKEPEGIVWSEEN